MKTIMFILKVRHTVNPLNVLGEILLGICQASIPVEPQNVDLKLLIRSGHFILLYSEEITCSLTV